MIQGYQKYMKPEYTLRYETWFDHEYHLSERMVEFDIEKYEEMFYYVMDCTDAECDEEFDETKEVMLAKIANDLDYLYDELEEYDKTEYHEMWKLQQERW